MTTERPVKVRRRSGTRFVTTRWLAAGLGMSVVVGLTGLAGSASAESGNSGGEHTGISPQHAVSAVGKTPARLGELRSSVRSTGYALGVSGDVAVATASDGRTFRVSLFVKPPSGWSTPEEETAVLLNPFDDTSVRFFGASIAIDADTVVVGAPSRGTGAPVEGHVYVYVRPAGGWTGEIQAAATLIASIDTSTGFGFDVAVHGDTVVTSENLSKPGFIFTKPASGWSGIQTEDARLKVPNSIAVIRTVAVNGDIAVLCDNNNSMSGGVAYAYERPVNGWDGSIRPVARLARSHGTSNDRFCESIAMSDSMLAVGAIYANHEDGRGGAVYVYTERENWAGKVMPDATIFGRGDSVGNGFGWNVALLDDDAILVSAGAGDDHGGVPPDYVSYVTRPDNGWHGRIRGDKTIRYDRVEDFIYLSGVALSSEAIFVPENFYDYVIGMYELPADT